MFILCKAWDNGFLIPKFDEDHSLQNTNVDININQIITPKIEVYKKSHFLPLFLNISKSKSKHDAYYQLADLYFKCSISFFKDKYERDTLLTFINKMGNYLLTIDFDTFINDVKRKFISFRGSKDKPPYEHRDRQRFQSNPKFRKRR